MRLKNKVTAITGAGRGIGESAAKLFAREGAQVAILEIDEESGQRVASEIGDAAVFVKTDVSDPISVQDAFEFINKHFGRLDGLYNNASVFWGQRDAQVTDLDLDVYHQIIAINQHSVVYCCKYAIPIIIAAGGGAVVNTASSAAITGIPGSDAYTASKGATVTLTRPWPSNTVRTGCASIALPRRGSTHP